MKAAVSRIHSAFERLARERRKALIPYVTAGDPRAEVTVPLMPALVPAGADRIELGVPLPDPMSAAPVNQPPGERAAEKQVGVDDGTAIGCEFRDTVVWAP